MWHWYYKVLANRPHLVLLSVAVFSIACIVISLTFKKLPEFTDPALGFEARGTEIGHKLTAWKNLLDEIRPRGSLTANPYDSSHSAADDFPIDNIKQNKSATNQRRKNKTKIQFKKKLKFIKENVASNKTTSSEFNFFDESDDHSRDRSMSDNSTVAGAKNNTAGVDNRHEHWDYGRNLSYVHTNDTDRKLKMKKEQWNSLRNFNPPSSTTDIHIPTDGYFCDSPNSEYAHFVLQRDSSDDRENITSKSMFDLDILLAICDIEMKLVQTDYYGKLCQTEMDSKRCCRPWSLPNYIALLSNKSSCRDIEEEDIGSVKMLLQECYEYYHSLKLSNNCVDNKCRAPMKCVRHNAIYNILHFLVDINFIKVNSSNIHLSASMIFLPIAKSTKALPFYYNIIKNYPQSDVVKIVAMDMGIKNALFDDQLIKDAWLIGLSGIFILLCIWLYTNSFFITIMTVVANLFSLGIAYFVYTFLFELTFFPFMNLLAVIVLIGVGADDVFIFVKIWNCTKAERAKTLGIPAQAHKPSEFPKNVSYPDTLTTIMTTTVKHAASSILVTSLTTAIAFYTSYLSSITAIKCFGIFAGTAVVTNYLVIMTWLPASVSLQERMSCYSFQWCIRWITKFNTSVSNCGMYIQDIIIAAILKMPLLWILSLGSVGILSGFIVFYWPRFRLPDSPDFQLFESSHPFELYDSKYKNMFWFEKIYTDMETFKLPMRFVWGVQPVDDGNYFIPLSRGTFHLDSSLNMSAVESQEWLLNFCRELKKQPFYQMTIGTPMLPSCFIENFISIMQRRCIDGMRGHDRSPCCESVKFPYPPHIFDECLPEIISILYGSPRYVFVPGIAGPKFERRRIKTGNATTSVVTTSNITSAVISPSKYPILQVVVVEYESSQAYTMAYEEMANFNKKVGDWFHNITRSAPAGLQNGWFISDLNFFDLQMTLSEGTLSSILLAAIASLIVLLLVSLNIFVSLYAVITVTLTMLATIACLVLLGWRLNILESISVSTAIGLSVDFTLHYGVHYRTSPSLERDAATRYSLSRMIGPTIMAAVTTGAAGAFMLPSNVLAYIQIGKFLLIVMSISWLYGTFFFGSLLCTIGPQNGFGQLKLTSLRKRESKTTKQHNDKRLTTHGTVSEQLLSASSSAAGEFIGSESHELSSLHSNTIIKPASTLETRPINFDRAFKNRYSAYSKEQSPTSASAITEVLPSDDNDLEHGVKI